jgi:large subunit ribosomal protein L5
MRDIYIDKVVVHMGVGESGEKLVKAENIMKTITGQTSIRTIAKMTQPAFSIRKGAPIGCKVTLRGKTARDFFATAVGILNKTVFESQFDKSGNISFGLEEHTDFPGMSYDPQIGIFGMDVNVVLERKGIRITRRRVARKKLPAAQRVSKQDAIAFLKQDYQVEVR